MFGLMLKDRAHAAVIYGVMLAMLVVGVVVAIDAEAQPSAAVGRLAGARGGNMEGKEVRLGPVASATWAAMTTATSNGSVNCMHDSLNPIGGLVPMALMMLNVVFSGIGAGFLNMLMYIIVAVFLAGLMVGRTPEYLGKKVEAKEVKLAMIAVLIHPLLISCGTGLFAATRWGTRPRPIPARTASARSSTSSLRPRPTTARASRDWPTTTRRGTSPRASCSCWAGSRALLPLAIAGFLAEKKRVPQTTGTLRTNNLTFAGMLLGTVLLVVRFVHAGRRARPGRRPSDRAAAVSPEPNGAHHPNYHDQLARNLRNDTRDEPC